MKVNLVLEGFLEEPTARRLVLYCGHEVGAVSRLDGAKNIKNKAHKYHSMTKRGEAVFVLTDSMDTGESCVPQAKREYLERHIQSPSPHFLLRFAVRELESWLLADRGGIADYLCVPLIKIPTAPETLDDPKREMVRLASKSRSCRIRDEIVPDAKHRGLVAPGYTGAVTRFIIEHWDIDAAQECSESLRRCIRALKRL